MIFTATIPLSVRGTAARQPGGRNPGSRHHTFWLERDVLIPSVSEADAPQVASWNAAFDERLVYRTSRTDWGAYPRDGEQHVRYHAGRFWRPALRSDIGNSDNASEVVDANAFAASFDRPTENRLLRYGPLTGVRAHRPVVRSPEEFLDRIEYDAAKKAYDETVRFLDRMPNLFIVVAGTVYTACVEPLIELSDNALGDRDGKFRLLLRVITDERECKWRLEKTPERVFPLHEFDEAMETAAAAADPGYDPAAAVDPTTNTCYDEVRRPRIQRPDLITQLDRRSFQALAFLRRFLETCETIDDGTAGPERRRLQLAMTNAIYEHDSGDTSAFGRIEDTIASLHAAWSDRLFSTTWLETAITLLEERPIYLPQNTGGPRP